MMAGRLDEARVLVPAASPATRTRGTSGVGCADGSNGAGRAGQMGRAGRRASPSRLRSSSEADSQSRVWRLELRPDLEQATLQNQRRRLPCRLNVLFCVRIALVLNRLCVQERLETRRADTEAFAELRPPA
jgi:hypothetical protein